MNTVSLPAIMGDFSALLDVRCNVAPFDAYNYHVTLWEAQRDGWVRPGAASRRAVVTFDGRMIASLARQGGSGPLVSTLIKEMGRGASAIFEERALRQLVRHIDFALFAIDHDNGHGVEVANGLREMWALSGPDTWAAYAEKREAIFAWLEIAPKPRETP